MNSLSTDASPTERRTAGSLGEWCVQRGLATPRQVDECLAIQREEERAGRTPPRLGELLVRMKLLTPEQVAQALGDQQTEVRYCPRCQIRVNVSLPPDAIWYRCTRCQGPLTSPPSAAQIDVVDDGAIVVSRDPLPPDVQEASLAPERRFGKYILLRPLGSGGVGRVDLAWDTYLSQYVALKRLRPRLEGETSEMAEAWTYSLIKEARHSIRLRHPGIVSVFDVGRINKDFYIAMEFLEGETLHDRLTASKRGGHWSPYYEHPKQILRALVEVARAVHYAHTRPSPVVHCDLKPSNIFLGVDGRTRVFDFGLARNVQPDREEDGEISGTPSYMAPEQAAGRTNEIDARTDVWAFGAILYEMFTGHPPFVGQTFEILHRTITERPKPIKEAIRDTTRQLKPGEISTRQLVQIPPALEELCMKCLIQDRAGRPATMAEIADQIESCLGARTAPKPDRPSSPPPGPEPVPAIPAPAPAATLPAPKRRLPALLAGGALLAAASALIGWGLFRPESPEAAANRALASLRLSEALAASGGGTAAEEIQAVVHLRDRLVAHLSAAPVLLHELRLRETTLRSVKVDSADASSLRVTHQDARVRIPWSDLEPSQFLGLVHDYLAPLGEDDRLALGVYCCSLGRKAEAKGYLMSLRGSGREPQALRVLRRMED